MAEKLLKVIHWQLVPSLIGGCQPAIVPTCMERIYSYKQQTANWYNLFMCTEHHVCPGIMLYTCEQTTKTHLHIKRPCMLCAQTTCLPPCVWLSFTFPENVRPNIKLVPACNYAWSLLLLHARCCRIHWQWRATGNPIKTMENAG